MASKKMKYTSINPELFINNRKNFAEKLKPGSLAVFNSNDEMPRSADGTFPFRQNSELFYLSGIDQEQTILLLFPDCPNATYKEVIFLKKTNDLIAIWEGHKHTMEEAKETSGISSVFWLEEFEGIFHMLMNWCENVYVNLNEHDRFRTDVEYRDLRFANALKKKYPLHKYERSYPILSKLRQIKSDEEIKLIKEAIAITEKAFRRILKFIKPGVKEYEIEAEILHEFILNRATGPAYSSIIASGTNANVLHYVDNNQECKADDLVLMDFGAEYANYAADLTRTVPANGKFTKRQAEVYQSVKSVMDFAKTQIKAGNTFEKLNKEVGKFMEEEMIKLNLLKKDEVKKQDAEKPLYKKYFMHGISHFLGLDVHDVGSKFETFEPGMVFTIEPGIYIREENFGIRLENDVMLTKSDLIDLMQNTPIEIEEIESLMN